MKKVDEKNPEFLKTLRQIYLFLLKKKENTKAKNEYKPSEPKEKLEKLRANFDRQKTIFKDQNNETVENTNLVR